MVREISYSPSGVTVKTEDNSVYRADYVMVSASLGVLQSDLIQFKPQLPVSPLRAYINWTTMILLACRPTSPSSHNSLATLNQSWKVVAIYQFDMAVYTKIFVKFPKRFWPEGKGREFFLYASSRRGYYAVWQVVAGRRLVSSDKRNYECHPTEHRLAVRVLLICFQQLIILGVWEAVPWCQRPPSHRDRRGV